MYDSADRKDLPVALRTATFRRDDEAETDGVMEYLPNIQQLLDDINTELSAYEHNLGKGPRDNSRTALVSIGPRVERWSLVIRELEPLPNCGYYVSYTLDRETRQASLAERSDHGNLAEIKPDDLPEIIDMERVITGLRALNRH